MGCGWEGSAGGCRIPAGVAHSLIPPHLSSLFSPFLPGPEMQGPGFTGEEGATAGSSYVMER